jgi:pantoate--beta-alanine ligase
LRGNLSFLLKIFYHSNAVSKWAQSQTGGVSLVPTMGALHLGHLALVEKARVVHRPVLVSIYVNPAQFNNEQDLQKYPRSIKEDLRLLQHAGVDAVYLPVTADLYPVGLPPVSLDLGTLGQVFEGYHRPGHFEGVVKVLHRLFSIIHPSDVFFGQKDLQQCLVVEKLITHCFQGIQQHNQPTKRDPSSGLALSSRNMRLSEEGAKQAGAINWALQLALIGKTLDSGLAEAREYLEKRGIQVEYLDVVSLPDMATAVALIDKKTAAVFAGYVEGVRLIDNHIYEHIPEIVVV